MNTWNILNLLFPSYNRVTHEYYACTTAMCAGDHVLSDIEFRQNLHQCFHTVSMSTARTVCMCVCVCSCFSTENPDVWGSDVRRRQHTHAPGRCVSRRDSPLGRWELLLALPTTAQRLELLYYYGPGKGHPSLSGPGRMTGKLRFRACQPNTPHAHAPTPPSGLLSCLSECPGLLFLTVSTGTVTFTATRSLPCLPPPVPPFLSRMSR